MIAGATDLDTADSLDAASRRELAQADAVLGTVAPILRHLLTNDDQTMFADDVIARVRGMTSDIARQLLMRAADRRSEEGPEPGSAEIEALAARLVGCEPVIGHIHALALEWQLTERLQSRLALDPVLSPLLQALVASSDATTSGLAMHLLAAQARFCQQQRRMRLPIYELPGDLLHEALVALTAGVSDDEGRAERAAATEAQIRAAYQEGSSRLGLIAQIVTGMGGGALAALSITHAGAAIFLSALSFVSSQERDVAVLATNESQVARLALSLRAAGLKSEAIEEQLLALHANVPLPKDFGRLGADRAAAILAVSGGI